MLVRRPADIRIKSGDLLHRQSIFLVSRLEIDIWSSPDDRVLRVYSNQTIIFLLIFLQILLVDSEHQETTKYLKLVGGLVRY